MFLTAESFYFCWLPNVRQLLLAFYLLTSVFPLPFLTRPTERSVRYPPECG
jgi:hypothetical protein